MVTSSRGEVAYYVKNKNVILLSASSTATKRFRVRDLNPGRLGESQVC